MPQGVLRCLDLQGNQASTKRFINGIIPSLVAKPRKLLKILGYPCRKTIQMVILCLQCQVSMRLPEDLRWLPQGNPESTKDFTPTLATEL